jgi:hypothetical protein
MKGVDFEALNLDKLKQKMLEFIGRKSSLA